MGCKSYSWLKELCYNYWYYCYHWCCYNFNVFIQLMLNPYGHVTYIHWGNRCKTCNLETACIDNNKKTRNKRKSFTKIRRRSFRYHFREYYQRYLNERLRKDVAFNDIIAWAMIYCFKPTNFAGNPRGDRCKGCTHTHTSGSDTLVCNTEFIVIY